MMQIGWLSVVGAGPARAQGDRRARGTRHIHCRKELKARVRDSTYRSLSDGDIRFLRAMLADEGESRMADIVARMGVSASYAGQYRNRLLAHGAIGERRRGVVGRLSSCQRFGIT